ncbi:MAG: hypothetical protein ABWY25_11755 [Paenisporosarcina sp.]
MSKLLPATTKKHFNLNVKDELQESILEFCVEALQIPIGHLVQYDRVPNMDSFYVYVRTGQRFIVTGQEIHHWETGKNNPCVPGRDEVVYDQ